MRIAKSRWLALFPLELVLPNLGLYSMSGLQVLCTICRQSLWIRCMLIHAAKGKQLSNPLIQDCMAENSLHSLRVGKGILSIDCWLTSAAPCLLPLSLVLHLLFLFYERIPKTPRGSRPQCIPSLRMPYTKLYAREQKGHCLNGRQVGLADSDERRHWGSWKIPKRGALVMRFLVGGEKDHVAQAL